MRNAVPAVITIMAATIGCSAGPAALDDRSASPAAPAITSVTPDVLPLSRDAAAGRYLSIVRPYNDALEGLERAVNAGSPVATLRPLAEATAAANRTHIAELRAVSWPTDILPAMATLLAESERAQPHWDRAARATTRDDLIESVLAAAEHNGADAAATIRALLSLEQYDERDHGGGG